MTMANSTACFGKTALLVHPRSGTTLGPLLVKQAPKGKGNANGTGKENTFTFQFREQGTGHLRIKKNGMVDHQGGQGKWAQFIPTFRVNTNTNANARTNATDDSHFLLRSVGNSDKNFVLAVDQESGKTIAMATDAAPAAGLWQLKVLAPAEDSQQQQGTQKTNAAAVGPAWTRGEIEKPLGKENQGTYTTSVYTAEQQERLHVDKLGQALTPQQKRQKLRRNAQRSAVKGNGKGKGHSTQPEGVLKWLVAGAGSTGAKYGPFLVSEGKGGAVLFKCGSDNGNLRTGPGGRLGVNGGAGKWAQYMLAPATVTNTTTTDATAEAGKLSLTDCTDTVSVRLLNVGNADKNWCLAATKNHLLGNHPATTDDGAPADPTTIFRLVSVATTTEAAAFTAPGATWTARTASHQHTDFDEGVTMTAAQKQHFVEQGYVQIKAAVPRKLVNTARGAINAALLTPEGVTTDDDGKAQFCRSLGSSPAILDLLYGSSIWTHAQHLLGKGAVARANNAQIALRAPNQNLQASQDKDDATISAKQWHIDGAGKGKHSPFSLLVGVTLSPQLKPNHGNLCLFPGSHVTLLPLIKDAGVQFITDSEAKPALDNGVQLAAGPGDAVFVHQKLAHRGGPNASSDIRYQVYFRLSHKDHKAHVESGRLLDDLWVEFEGIAGLG